MKTTLTAHQAVAASIAEARAGHCSPPFLTALAILEEINDDAERFTEAGQWEQLDSLLAGLKAIRRIGREGAA